MAEANINHVQLEEYLTELRKRDMLENAKRNGTTFYTPTAKDRAFLNQYEKVKQILDSKVHEEPVWGRYSAP